jgi:hypothetical protein
MKGTVEVFKIVDSGEEELLYKEDNLVVNLAGQSIVDMLTTPSSLLGIESASSIMDTSNWVVQAISFGKDATAYKVNAHQYPGGGPEYRTSDASPGAPIGNLGEGIRKNLLPFSTPSSCDLRSVYCWPGPTGEGQVPSPVELCSAPWVTPPPAYENIPSSIAHTFYVLDDDADVLNESPNEQLSQSLIGGNKSWTGGYLYTDGGTTSGFGSDNWICYSCYLKNPTHVPFSTLGPSGGVTDPSSTNLPYRTAGIRLDIKADTASATSIAGNLHSVGCMEIAFENPRDEEPFAARFRPFSKIYYEGSGHSIDGWTANGGVIPAGNGWYRAYVSILAPVSGIRHMTAQVHPMGIQHTDGLPLSGAIYGYGMQVERGRFPTDLQFNNTQISYGDGQYGGYSSTMWDWSGGPLNSNVSTSGSVSDPGTVRVSGTYYSNGDIVSSYTPTNNYNTLSRKYPDPLDYHLVTTDMKGNILDTRTDMAASSILSGLNIGQNLNMLPYREQKGWLTTDASSGVTDLLLYNPSEWPVGTPLQGGAAWNDQTISGSTYVSGGSFTKKLQDTIVYTKDPVLERWANTGRGIVSGQGSVGPQGLLMGCYAQGSSTGGSPWVMVSSLDSSAAYANPMLSGTYEGGFNEASSMDALGFVGKVYNPGPSGTPGGRLGGNGDGVALSAYSLIVSSPGQWNTPNNTVGNVDFGDFRKVVYECTISSGDCGMANLYGGITNIGLWTIDVEDTLKRDTAPFSFYPPMNTRKYRLFSSKKFIQNLTSVNDDITAVNPGGAFAYKDLKIRWTLDFGAAGNG